MEANRGMPLPPSAAAWRGVALGIVLFTFLSVRACERYTMAYQSFPAVDWVESQPFWSVAGEIPPAFILAEGLAHAYPDLGVGGVWEDFEVAMPTTGSIIRTMNSYRDSARVVKSGDVSGGESTTLRLGVIVFHRPYRAEAWADLRAAKLDLAREAAGESKMFRVSGPVERDGVWIEAVRKNSPHVANVYVVGVRGPVGFELQVTNRTAFLERRGDVLDQPARAELLARDVTDQWTTWLLRQPYARDW